jgi:putative oxidoreductase
LIEGLQSYGLLILRLIFAGALIAHALPKLGRKKERILDAMRAKGIPGPVTLIVGYFELAAGLLIAIGLGVQIVALLTALKSIGGIYVSRRLFGRTFDHGYEVDLAYLAISLALFMLGAGVFSIDNLIIPRL